MRCLLYACYGNPTQGPPHGNGHGPGGKPAPALELLQVVKDMHEGVLDHIFHERLIQRTAGLDTRGKSPTQERSQVRNRLGLDRSARLQVAYPAGILAWSPHRYPASSPAYSGPHSRMDAASKPGSRTVRL